MHIKRLKLTSNLKLTLLLGEKCPYLEFFGSIFSPDVEKYGPENSEYGHFHAIF